jgi:hypothetical protein
MHCAGNNLPRLALVHARRLCSPTPGPQRYRPLQRGAFAQHGARSYTTTASDKARQVVVCVCARCCLLCLTQI